MIKLRSDMIVQLMQHMGSDSSIVAAAKVSTQGPESRNEYNAESSAGLINFLMKNRHGTPFEHNSLTFYIEAPIFVFREFHRHRVGWSYNEMSGRYRELEPEFYLPSRDRPLVQEGKPGAYTFVQGDSDQYEGLREQLDMMYRREWATYRRLLYSGVAKEVARIVLPVGIYSAMYATCNARSLMHFLSLRTKDSDAMFPSYPMAEIEMVAHGMEKVFEKYFPITYESFVKNRRVCP